MPRKPEHGRFRLDPLDVTSIQSSLDPYGHLERFEIPKITEDLVAQNCKLYNQRCFEQVASSFAAAKRGLMNRDIPQPVNCESGKLKQAALETSTYLRNARTFARLAAGAGELANPILTYYSAKLAVSFFTQMFLMWENPKFHHGLTFSCVAATIDPESIDKCYKVAIGKAGGFQRLVDLLTIFGYPSPFSSIITYLELKDGASMRQIPFAVWLDDLKAIHTFTNTSGFSYLNAPNITLLELLNCDRADLCGTTVQELERRGVTSGLDTLEATAEILLIFLSMFASSNLTRYHPLAWNSIISGTETGIYHDLRNDLGNLHRVIQFLSGPLNALSYYASS
ncbi:MAG TPA: hypothetical protein VGK99_15290 [Acidobacteriota bacterium]